MTRTLALSALFNLRTQFGRFMYMYTYSTLENSVEYSTCRYLCSNGRSLVADMDARTMCAESHRCPARLNLQGFFLHTILMWPKLKHLSGGRRNEIKPCVPHPASIDRFRYSVSRS